MKKYKFIIGTGTFIERFYDIGEEQKNKIIRNLASATPYLELSQGPFTYYFIKENIGYVSFMEEGAK